MQAQASILLDVVKVKFVREKSDDEVDSAGSFCPNPQSCGNDRTKVPLLCDKCGQ
jgi:hypothetical protein